jgi:hypothetical protein
MSSKIDAHFSLLLVTLALDRSMPSATSSRIWERKAAAAGVSVSVCGADAAAVDAADPSFLDFLIDFCNASTRTFILFFLLRLLRQSRRALRAMVHADKMSAEEVCREWFLRRWFEEEDPVDLEFSKSSVWGSLSCARRNSYTHWEGPIT